MCQVTEALNQEFITNCGCVRMDDYNITSITYATLDVHLHLRRAAVLQWLMHYAVCQVLNVLSVTFQRRVLPYGSTAHLCALRRNLSTPLKAWALRHLRRRPHCA